MATAIDPNTQYQIDHSYETQVPKLVAAFATCLFIPYAAVILRLVSRRLNKTCLGADDWLVIASLPFTTIFIGLDLAIIPYGLGRHAVTVTNPQALVKGITIAEVFYVLSISIIKISILSLLRRLFPGRSFMLKLWVVSAIIAAYTVTQFFCVVLQCVPINAIWNKSIVGRCINLDDVFIVCSSFNIATDVIILALPMPKLWALKILTKQKIQLTAIFLLGGFVCIISIIRQTKLKDISQVDTSWSDVGSAIWSVLECSIATLSACVPTFRPLFSKALRRGNKISIRQATSPTGKIYRIQRSAEPGDTDSHGLGLFSRVEALPEQHLDATSDSYPFARMNNKLERNWQDDIALSRVDPVRVREQRVPTNEIKVITDLEQRIEETI
ncbi:MAG: hypothetical protein Q9187_006042 [Circinaria calcarea]